MEIAAQIISQLGFPIFVATYLMLSYDKKLSKMLEELRRFRVVIVTLAKVIGDDQDNDSVPQRVIDDISGVAELEEIGKKEN